nr:RCC1 domain-containing protein [Corallococcus sp. CA054B]
MTATITNDVAPAITRSFGLSVVACPDAPLVAGGRYHSVMLRRDGTVLEWSSFTPPRRRLDPTGARTDRRPRGGGGRRPLPRPVHGWHRPGLGDNSGGLLGNGGTDTPSRPVRVVGLTESIAFVAAGDFSLALRKGGTVWAWG